MAGRAQVEQVLDREVDGDVQVEPVDPPLGELRERGLEHVQGQRPHQRGVLGVREERARAAQAVHGVLPAHERLDAGDAAGREVDLRLVVQDQLVALERAAQLGDQRQPLARVAVARRVVGLEAGARLLGLVHRDVGALQQRVGVGAVLRAERGADARVHHDLEPVDLERVLERDADPAPDLGRARQPGAGQQQRELVAAEPRDEAVRRRPPPAGAGRAGQQPVAGVVAERVVELLEAVEVDHRDGQRSPSPSLELRREALVEQAAVREPGQLVGQRELARGVQRGVLEEGQRHPDRAPATSVAADRKTAASVVWWKWSSDEQAAGDEREQRRRDEHPPALERDRRAARGPGSTPRRRSAAARRARAPAPTARGARRRARTTRSRCRR